MLVSHSDLHCGRRVPWNTRALYRNHASHEAGSHCTRVIGCQSDEEVLRHVASEEVQMWLPRVMEVISVPGGRKPCVVMLVNRCAIVA
jgi:hypothetical protein